MKLLINLNTSESSSIFLIDNLTPREFERYIGVDSKTIGVDENADLEELNLILSNEFRDLKAIQITNPIDERIKNIDGIISLQIAI